MKKRVAIIQSSYIPWKGYFDLINSVDELILLDDVQYTRRDWRNRNVIKTARGPLWLSIPVKVKGKYLQRVCETEIGSADWNRTHWKTIAAHYAKAPYFTEYRDVLEGLYMGATATRLSEVNGRFLEGLCGLLGIDTRLSWSMDYTVIDGKTERLVDLCRQAAATEYLSGPSARAYIDEALFAQAGIAVRYMDYSGYPEYRQLYGAFDHHFSVIDLILNTGPSSTQYMKSFGQKCGTT